MIFRAGVVAWRNTRQDLNWHLFGGDVLEGWCWKTCFEELGIEAECAYNFGILSSYWYIYMKIPAEFNSNDIFAQPKLKININLELLIMTSTSISNTFSSFHPFFVWKKLYKDQIPKTIPTNQPTNRDQPENPLPANPSRDSPWPTHRHPSILSRRSRWLLSSMFMRFERWKKRRPSTVVSCREGGWLFFVTLHSKLTWQRKIHLFQ